jgi:hypothetical protein
MALTIHQLRDSLRKGLFLQIKREAPTATNLVALRLARMKEKQAWKRRDESVVCSLCGRIEDAELARLEQRFQQYFKPRLRLADNLTERSRHPQAAN